MTIVVCIDGCGGTGKTTFIQQCCEMIEKHGYTTRHITDSQVFKDIEKCATSFAKRRHHYRALHFAENVDVIFQERGIISHVYYDHRENVSINTCLDCALENTPPIFRNIHFHCTPDILLHRLLHRDRKIPEDIEYMHNAFMSIAECLGWDNVNTSDTAMLSALADKLYEEIKGATKRN